MAGRRNTKDVGSDSRGSGIAKEQRNRPGKAHEHEPTVRKGYEEAQNPEPQGDGDPGPDPISEP